MCIFILMNRYLEKVKKEVEKQLDNDVFFVNNEEEVANNLNKILLKTIFIQKEEISSNSQYYVQVGDIFISKKDSNVDMSNEDIDKIVNAILKFADLQNSRDRDYIYKEGQS